MPHRLRRASGPRPLREKAGTARHIAGPALICLLLLGTGAGVASARSTGAAEHSMDVSAPPIALLFGMAALGLFLGRRK